MRIEPSVRREWVFNVACLLQAAAVDGADALLPFYMSGFGVPVALIALPFALNGVARVISDLGSGVLSDYLRTRVLLLAATGGGAALALLAGAAGHVGLFVILWASLGLADAMFGIGIRKATFEAAPPGRQGRAVAAIATAFGAGYALGPFVGGYIGQHFGPRMLFLVYAGPVGLSCLLMALFAPVDSPIPAGPRRDRPWRVGRRLFASPGFGSACLSIGYAFFTKGGISKLAFPLFAVRAQGLALGTMGVILGISQGFNILGRVVGGPLCDRWGSRPALVASFALSVPALVVLVWGQGFLLLLLPLALLGFGRGLINVAATLQALQAVPAESRGLALGIFRVFSSFGLLAGPLLTGALLGLGSFTVTFLVLAGLSALCLPYVTLSGPPVAAPAQRIGQEA